MRAARLLLFPLLLPLLLSHCATIPPLPSVTPPAEEVFQQVKARQEAVQGLKGLAQIKVSSPAKSFSVQQVLFARLPAFLRMESLSPLGTPLLYLVTDGRELSLYNPEENRYYRGGWRTDSLSFALPVALSPEEAVFFLLGGGPLREPETMSLRPDEGERLWVLELLYPSRGESQALWVNPQSFQVHRADITRPGLSFQLVYSDFRPVKDILFPHQMRLIAEGARTRIAADFPEVELNPQWGAEDFFLPVPRGATILPLP